ncbi:ABC transporter A family member 7-like isoform X3 [Syzygium oleosum]|uniref:ABC transporter A family member 7-like isoform X3 n=1 Tax=Syzygium oleosum TaxID=219896 RepID=UPI0024B994AF|nr:ABC transporter A family member 7-like isoform X3 [Syzygium oleosum]XP_056170523.1 ABC transporter A family member 7-like isoform X3 [Syzygium oleosum]XP_056170525.1 ABC transporter A family member 7-like isoform X3 [Syzygium oleosum]
MAEPSNGPASFWTQANALLRKNLTFQKRNIKTNIQLISFPFVLCLLLVLIQILVNHELDKPGNKCGCECIDTDGDGQCKKVCGIQYSTVDQAGTCPILNPPEWPPLLQIPAPQYRAVKTDFIPFNDLPNDSCRRTGSCPATVLFTGNNRSLGEILVGNMVPNSSTLNSSDVLGSLAQNVLGTASGLNWHNYLEPAFFSDHLVYAVQQQCTGNSSLTVAIQESSIPFQLDVSCAQGLHVWRNNTSAVNDELYKGYQKGNREGQINEIVAGYDFLNTNSNNFNVSIWYNSTYKNEAGNKPMLLVRVARSVNLASSAYVQFLRGPATKMLFEYVKEMPKPETEVRLDFASLLGPLFFTWVIIQLFPVVLTALVYEKQQKLRIMMKMHGLGDGPYWLISYAYFLSISSIYMLCFVIFGSVIGLKFFTLNNYSIQFVFYFIYINLQISLAFLVAAFFSNVKTATVVGYICVFGTGLLGAFLFEFFVQDTSFPRGWIIVMELYPGFSLYRGLYELAQYSFTGNYMGTHGMRWGDLSDSENGLKEVLIIMVVEWLVVLFVAYCIDQVTSSGSGTMSLFQRFRKKHPSSFRRPSLQRQGSKVFVQMEKSDVSQEREKVEQLLLEPSTNHAIVCDNLEKVYPGRDGNPERFAVRGLSLALPPGECFGMLGPNGAGKTSFISMMIGLTKPTSGTAYVQGLDIRTHMDGIYTSMGVCPQHNLLWETLTGREHLLFYGRLKNLKGSALTQAVEESLKSANLFYGGVANKQAGKYSGGMKRRLSVAISLIGDPKVVYMDEPSTGLDPASRNNLWNVVKRAKQDRAIILTTHSMEEAEVLCDRLGIFVDGSLQCIGNPKELKARYGGSYVFTMTTSSTYEEEVENMVRCFSPGAIRIYQISGTQKFELPKHEVKIADVFRAVENAKSRFTVHAWGLTDTTLEDVFIKVARSTQAFEVLS